MDLLNIITGVPGVGPALPYIMAVVAVCAALAPMLRPPTQPASGVYPVLYAAVNFIALNFGHAKNATAPAAAPPAKMLGLLAAVIAAATLSACASGQDPRVAIATGWIAADSSVAAYVAQPGTSASNVAAARACENVAWPLVKPVSDSLTSKTPIGSNELSAAQDALSALEPCLTALGVKL